MNWREQKRRREEAAAGGGRNLVPSVHNVRGPSRESGPSIGSNTGTNAAAAVNKGSNSSWRYERKEQAAMVSKRLSSAFFLGSVFLFPDIAAVANTIITLSLAQLTQLAFFPFHRIVI